MTAGNVNNISFEMDMQLTISGIPKGNFQISLGKSLDDIGLYYGVEFKAGQANPSVILKGKKNGHWIDEQKVDDIPFMTDQQFQVTITFKNNLFSMTQPGDQTLDFRNPLDLTTYKHIWIDGQVTVKSIRLG